MAMGPIREGRDAAAVRHAERGVVAVVLVANVGQSLLPFGARFASNLGAAGAATLLARDAGLSWSELGLARDELIGGLRSGVRAGAVLALAVAVAGNARVSRRRFADARIAAHGRGRAAYELGARIPLETALAEEILFRSAVLGIALRHMPRGAAVAASSLLFGLWHVVPTWTGFGGVATDSAVGVPPPARLRTVAGVVAATTAAGAGFAVLRLRSKSVCAPVLAHAALNMTSFAVARSAARAARRTGGAPARP